MNSVAIIIPTTGYSELHDAIKSCLNQTYKNIKIYVVADGIEYKAPVDGILSEFDSSLINYYILNDNVGKNGFYGHRIYAGFSHLINCDYLCFLDQDCWFDVTHIESMMATINANSLDWCYSLRKIVDKDGNYICNDDCESLGKYRPLLAYNICDTNTYCIKTDIAIKISPYIHGKWGMDRVYYDVLSTNFKNFDCTGKYTVNYRLDGNQNSVKKEFFLHNNELIKEFPWRK